MKLTADDYLADARTFERFRRELETFALYVENIVADDAYSEADRDWMAAELESMEELANELYGRLWNDYPASIALFFHQAVKDFHNDGYGFKDFTADLLSECREYIKDLNEQIDELETTADYMERYA